MHQWFRLSLLWGNIFIFIGIWGRTTAEIQMDLNHLGVLPLTQTSGLVIAPRFRNVVYQMNKVTEGKAITWFQVNAVLFKTAERQACKLENLVSVHLHYTCVVPLWLYLHIWDSSRCKWDSFLSSCFNSSRESFSKDLLLDLFFRQDESACHFKIAGDLLHYLNFLNLKGYFPELRLFPQFTAFF